jgi:hypothetical protein
MIVVAGEAGMIGEVFGGIDARKTAEVVNEVSLIEIAAVESDIGPANGAAGSDAPKDRLEAANAAKEFRGQTDVVLEELDEVARAEAGFGDDLGDVGGLRGVNKGLDGVFHGGMVLEHACSALEER